MSKTNSVLELPNLIGIVELNDLAASSCSGGRRGNGNSGNDSDTDIPDSITGTTNVDGVDGTFTVTPTDDTSGTFSISNDEGFTFSADYDNATFSV